MGYIHSTAARGCLRRHWMHNLALRCECLFQKVATTVQIRDIGKVGHWDSVCIYIRGSAASLPNFFVRTQLHSHIRSHLPALLDLDRRSLNPPIPTAAIIQRNGSSLRPSNLILRPRPFNVRKQVGIIEPLERGILCTFRSQSCETARQDVLRSWLVLGAKGLLEDGREQRQARNCDAQQGFQICDDCQPG